VLSHGSGEQPLSAGTEWQLFIDDYIVGSNAGLTRIFHAPERRAALILEGTEPWEKWTIELNGRSVLYDPEARQFKMWYLSSLNDPRAHRGVQYKVCYAVSSDGIRWTRPDLGLVEWQGSRRNNILPWGEHWMRRPNVMIDPGDSDPTRRYKMLYTDVVGGKAGVNKAFSSDGIHWRIYYTGFNLPYGLQAKDRAQEGWVENGERKQRAIGLATLRLDGFASLQAGRSGGELRTRLLEVTADTLEVNSAVRGELRVEIEDRDGQPVPGFEARACDPIRGDGLRMPVRWRGAHDLSRLRGRPVRLRFILKDADLYAFAFRS